MLTRSSLVKCFHRVTILFSFCNDRQLIFISQDRLMSEVVPLGCYHHFYRNCRTIESTVVNVPVASPSEMNRMQIWNFKLPIPKFLNFKTEYLIFRCCERVKGDKEWFPTISKADTKCDVKLWQHRETKSNELRINWFPVAERSHREC